MLLFARLHTLAALPLPLIGLTAKRSHSRTITHSLVATVSTALERLSHHSVHFITRYIDTHSLVVSELKPTWHRLHRRAIQSAPHQSRGCCKRRKSWLQRRRCTMGYTLLHLMRTCTIGTSLLKVRKIASLKVAFIMAGLQ